MDDPTADSIRSYYDAYDEDNRLEDAFGALEKERTKELMARYLGKETQVILDVGGGTGAYSFWLAGLGHQIHLVDLTPRHIESARRKSGLGNFPTLAGLSVGDARRLDFPDAFADVLISHGPLYHLAERSDRIRTLEEARRVLKPGGMLLAFTITRYAGINYAITSGAVFDDIYFNVMVEEVQTGICNNTPRRIPTFPRAFFHLPQDIAAEIQSAGLIVETTLGIMGTAWLVPDLDNAWLDEKMRPRLLEAARLLENEPVLGPRMLTVARKGK